MLREIGEGDDERDPLRRLKSLGAAVLDKMLEPEFVKLQRIIIAEAASFRNLARPPGIAGVRAAPKSA